MFVLSTGRSGSTLLELLLATHRDITTVGEVQLLGHLLADPAARCGCGERLAECPFWTKVRLRREVRSMAPDPFRESVDAGRVVRPRWLPGVLTGKIDSTTRQHAVPYASSLVTIAAAAADESGARFVVDASKDPYRLHLLRAGGVAPRVIVLTRDPRGFVSSMAGAGPPVDRRVAVRRVMRYAIRWLVQNLIFERAAAASGTATTVRYEDLAADPLAALGAIARALGVDPDGFAIDHFREASNHAVGGNPMRGRADGIVLDERWHTDLSPGHQRLVWLIDGRWARRHGYSRGGS